MLTANNYKTAWSKIRCRTTRRVIIDPNESIGTFAWTNVQTHNQAEFRSPQVIFVMLYAAGHTRQKRQIKATTKW